MPLNISPPLLNSSSPWATTIEELQSLYDCPHTGAVSTRTSLQKQGFNHNDAVHQYVFFDAGNGNPAPDRKQPASKTANGDIKVSTNAEGISSLNTLGYSPIPLAEYLKMIKTIISTSRQSGAKEKPFIVSVTGSAEEVAESYEMVATTAFDHHLPLHMEVNLSCPNIAGKPPPAYDKAMLLEFLDVIGQIKLKNRKQGDEDAHQVLVGIKTPPYTYMGQFQGLVEALAEAAKVFHGSCPVDFITATNTLGSSLILSSDGTPELNSEAGTGIGGMAGASLHPLSLGNVATIRKLLDQQKELKGLEIIGVGGVADADGFKRMTSAGASAVALATALGREGVGVFGKILGESK